MPSLPNVGKVSCAGALILLKGASKAAVAFGQLALTGAAGLATSLLSSSSFSAPTVRSKYDPMPGLLAALLTPPTGRSKYDPMAGLLAVLDAPSNAE
jgi:hypothetical protein